MSSGGMSAWAGKRRPWMWALVFFLGYFLLFFSRSILGGFNDFLVGVLFDGIIVSFFFLCLQVAIRPKDLSVEVSGSVKMRVRNALLILLLFILTFVLFKLLKYGYLMLFKWTNEKDPVDVYPIREFWFLYFYFLPMLTIGHFMVIKGDLKDKEG